MIDNIKTDNIIYNNINMGSAIFRNRYWWYKSLYDDYTGR
jgi:hypothetical protein